MDNQISLREYETIKNDMNLIIAERNRLLEFTITVSVAITGVLIGQGKGGSNLYLIPGLLLLHGYFRYYTQTVRFLKMNAYLIEVIERKVRGLKWHGWEEVYKTRFFIRADSYRPGLLLTALIAVSAALADRLSLVWWVYVLSSATIIGAAEYFRRKNRLSDCIEEWRCVRARLE